MTSFVRTPVNSLWMLVFLLFCQTVKPVNAQSPFRLSWAFDGPLLGISAGVGGLTMIATAQRDPLTTEEIAALDPFSINAFDRPAIHNYSITQKKLSDVLLGFMIVLPAGLLTSAKIRKDALTIGVMYAETVILANLAPQMFKVLTPRVRPYVYNPGAPLSEKTNVDARASFFSGHTSNTFAAAVFLSTVYATYYPESDWSTYIWAGTLSLAAGVGYLRYSSGKHFPTDIITGAVWGSAVGFFIPHLHRTGKGPQLSLGTLGRQGYDWRKYWYPILEISRK